LMGAAALASVGFVPVLGTFERRAAVDDLLDFPKFFAMFLDGLGVPVEAELEVAALCKVAIF